MKQMDIYLEKLGLSAAIFCKLFKNNIFIKECRNLTDI